jgi:hypothetical protein
VVGIADDQRTIVIVADYLGRKPQIATGSGL